MKKYLFIATIISFLLPATTSAQIKITEIMYNPEGTDSGYEWIELYNSGETDVDLDNYRFTEGGTNHTFKEYNDGNIILSAKKYAVIADNPDKFIEKWTDFSGHIIDSAFSLKNTGEELQITQDGQIIDAFTYNPELGADGNGNSLQLNAEEIFIPAKPTPASINKEEPDNESLDESTDLESDNEDQAESTDISTHAEQVNLSKHQEKIALETGIGRERVVNVNSPIQFVANHNQSSDRKIKFIWNFGDGNTDRGSEVEYTYKKVGKYNVVLNSKKGGSQAISRTTVTVIQPELDIKLISSGKAVDVQLINMGKVELNLGKYILKFGDNSYEIPVNTIISADSSITLSGLITGFTDTASEFQLLYPNQKTLKSVDTKEFSQKHQLMMKLNQYLSLEEKPALLKEVRNILESV